jgi:tetratricopeptide (TPR) repeat protein
LVVAALGVFAAASEGTACRALHLARGGEHRVPGPLASALLAFAAESGAAPSDVAEAWHAIEIMADRIAAHPRGAGRDGEGEDDVDGLNAVVFGELGFSREVERTATRSMLLPSVVADRKGSCVGLGALYLVLAERLGIPLDGVMVPGHFFVRARASGTTRARNVELLRRGEAMPDSWYVGKYGPWPADATAYLRPLSPEEVLAIHWFNLGNQRRGDGDFTGAAEAYGRATDDLPAFAEAWASLGAMRQAGGDRVGAVRAYRSAGRANPDLPGLAQNLRLLLLGAADEPRTRSTSTSTSTPTTTTTTTTPPNEPPGPGHLPIHAGLFPQRTLP